MSRFNEHGLTPQQELFAQQVVSGKSLSDAYRVAYPRSLKWSQSTVHAESSRMASHHKVAARVRSMQAVSAEVAIFKDADILREIKSLALVDIGGIVGDGGEFKMLHELSPELRAAVASFKIDKDGVIEYKFWNKLEALEKAMKHRGLYEKDNDQQANPLRELLDSLGGAVIGVSSGKSRKK